MIRIAFDTNVVGYAEGLDDRERQLRATGIIEALRFQALVFPLQAAAELHRLLMRRRKIDPDKATSTIRQWQRRLTVHPETTATVMESALDLAGEHRLQVFDAIILAASAEAGCRMLLSEDMQDGFVWRGVTVTNPFVPTLHPMLSDLVRRRS